MVTRAASAPLRAASSLAKAAASPATTTSSSRGSRPSIRSRAAPPTRERSSPLAARLSSSGPPGQRSSAASTSVAPGLDAAEPDRLTPIPSVLADRDPGRAQIRLGLGDRVVPVVEDRCTQDRVGAGGQRLHEVLELAGAAGGDHGNADRLAHGGRQRQVIAVAGAVPVHAREQDLAGSALDRL